VKAVRALLRLATAAHRWRQRSARHRRWCERVVGWRSSSIRPGAVAIVGDSLATSFPVALLGLSPSRVFVRGCPGETAAELRGRLSETLDRAPSVLVLQTGTNDALRGVSPAALRIIHEEVLRACRRALPAATIVVASLPPITSWRVSPFVVREINRNLRDVAERSGASYVDVFTPMADARGRPAIGVAADGVHLTPAGYELLADLLTAFVSPPRSAAT
jgi:lysophospholipase L1-like esterase